mmetsp:Transcript_9085/g.19599  ORF Transcript_9085/g.19599 Transcript_9085/m.19599 type:complete len:375 (-) Transcript_9085:122-1246(-)|eukprot:CAMPEP_0168734652 /NCGR_PEP_ID=MMETSP0724-20121128/8924_1 /TAXON_ID=265536 /ORGANISM="Amphiprora sp., Strain CCMP467" /LENGTH=374 /DNA_ID=CAMNT_0008781763 /DNA_START=171 /DNA_END=1295 /DNA_ORIENTATION=-
MASSYGDNNHEVQVLEIPESTDVNRLDYIPTQLMNLPNKMPRNVTYRKRKSLPPGYKPGDFDVCCGRGKRHWNHVGNVRFRRMIQTNVERYMDAPLKNDKTAVVVSIVDDIRNLGGHFLKEDLRSNWYDIGDQQAREKVGHSLRDQVSTVNRQKRKEAAMQIFTGQTPQTAAPPPTTAAAAPPVSSNSISDMMMNNTMSNNNINNTNINNNAMDYNMNDADDLEPLPLGPPGSDNDVVMMQQQQQQQQPQIPIRYQSFKPQSEPIMITIDEQGGEEDEDAMSDHGENENEMMRTLKSSQIIERFARRPSFASSVTNPHNSLSSSNSRSVHDSRTSRMSSARSSGWSFLQNLDLDLDQFEDFDGTFEPIAYKSES